MKLGCLSLLNAAGPSFGVTAFSVGPSFGVTTFRSLHHDHASAWLNVVSVVERLDGNINLLRRSILDERAALATLRLARHGVSQLCHPRRGLLRTSRCLLCLPSYRPCRRPSLHLTPMRDGEVLLLVAMMACARKVERLAHQPILVLLEQVLQPRAHLHGLKDFGIII
eukprot:TRINITY_DN18273_c0_g1_i1.p1 TRINITY_DN18273_c0_g1~~TRINITY_DN18273_c0_g1_i1.p1  ORF type:complete len:168 (-),score=6.10 TRINITY_DN18273_c0_g1_i1:1-504(-)